MTAPWIVRGVRRSEAIQGGQRTQAVEIGRNFSNLVRKLMKKKEEKEWQENGAEE